MKGKWNKKSNNRRYIRKLLGTGIKIVLSLPVVHLIEKYGFAFNFIVSVKVIEAIFLNKKLLTNELVEINNEEDWKTSSGSFFADKSFFCLLNESLICQRERNKNKLLLFYLKSMTKYKTIIIKTDNEI